MNEWHALSFFMLNCCLDCVHKQELQQGQTRSRKSLSNEGTVDELSVAKHEGENHTEEVGRRAYLDLESTLGLCRRDITLSVILWWSFSLTAILVTWY